MSQRQTYWNSKPAHVVFMLLNREAEKIDPLEREEILSLLPSLKNKTVLELGAGIGRFTGEFVKLAKNVHAIDFCEHFTEENQRKNKKAHCETLNVMDAEFPPSTFDFVFMAALLMYLNNTEAQELLKRIKVWLKPNGHLFFRESCAAVTHDSQTEGYPAFYRSMKDYDQLAKDFQILKTDNLKAYEVFGDPFKFYWLCQKV